MGKWWRRIVAWVRNRAPAEPASESRRLALRSGAVAAAGLLIAGSERRAEAAEPPLEETAGPPTGARFGMSIDLDKCTGCNSCAVACQQENNIPVFGPEEKYDQRRIEWMSMLWQEPEEEGGFPSLMPFPCQHCSDAPCVKVCPVGATYRDSEGIVVQVWDRCIGCRYCMVACPYGRRSFTWEHGDPWDGSLVQLLNPDVATRPAGVVEKCTFCSHRIARAREDARLAGEQPTDDTYRHLTACSQACPSQAITFGDLNDPDSSVATQARSPRAFRLLEHLGTEPNVVYLRRDRREKDGQ